ncbi:MAG: hypothetical protein MZU91_04610 [Desulfosudis oleivorans]|nr:hypothetical protein [Desulfosudis oleivorans]
MITPPFASRTDSPDPARSAAPRRLRQRGFNQAVILAREISERHGVPLDFRTAQAASSSRHHRSGLGKEERRSNIRKASHA